MKRGFLLLLAVVAGLAPASVPAPASELPPLPAAGLRDGGAGTAVDVVDGDTLTLEDGVQVRLAGIQAPKLPLGRDHVEKWPLADDSRALLSRLALGRRLTLHHGGAAIDRYGRRLAHLTDGDGVWLQGALLAAGMARVYSFADNRALVAQMLAIEARARASRRGIWRLAWYAVRDAADQDGLGKMSGSLQLVAGRVRAAEEVRGWRYLNFGDDWRRDFTIAIAAADWPAFTDAGIALADFAGWQVRVRGWMKRRNGPTIRATHPEQIEWLDGPLSPRRKPSPSRR
jgi:micrococcal nuclease